MSKCRKQLTVLSEEIIHCCLCQRLVEFRASAPIRKRNEEEQCWRKPVPGFGDPEAWLLITGLAFDTRRKPHRKNFYWRCLGKIFNAQPLSSRFR